MKQLSAIILMSFIVCTFARPTFDETTTPCDPSRCKLPDCHCSSTSIPGDLPVSNIPQIVMITFDDAINERNMKFYRTLFSGKVNPNGCNISATFFVSHEYTNYVMLNELYHGRHAIVDHTITHRTPTSWWKQANYTQWQQEITGQRKIINKLGFVSIDDINGFRAPFLQIGGNNEFKVLHDAKFLFESSMPTSHFKNPPLWPYTLDYATIQECVIPPCPTDSFPGLWEVPMVDYVDLSGKLCSMVDGCTPPQNEEEAYQLFEKNFETHYTTNKGPFPMFFHATWFIEFPFTLSATNRFLEKLQAMKDVWVVTVPQAIEWIRNPTTITKINDFQPWKCSSPAPPLQCTPSTQTVCGYDDNRKLVPSGQPAVHYLLTCLKYCPQCYPWVGDPEGEQC